MKETELISQVNPEPIIAKIPYGKYVLPVLVFLVTGVVGLVIAYLIVGDNWLYAAVLLSVIPALLILHKNPFIGVLIWLLLTPFLLHTQIAASRQVYWLVHRILPILSIVFLILSSLFGTNKRKLPKLDMVEISMGGYIFVSIISIMLLNNDPAQTFFRFYDLYIIPMCLYLIIRLYVPNRKSLQLLIPIAIFITITQVTIGMVSWIAPSVLPSAWLTYQGIRTTGSVASVSVYTTTLVFTGLILLNVGLQFKKKIKRNIFILLFLSTLFAQFISYSRASWLAAILILIALAFMYPKFIGKFALMSVLLGLVMGSIFLQSSYFQTARDRLTSAESENSALSRLPVYVAAIRMFNEKPLFGWGYDNFDRFDRRFQGRFGDLVNPDEKDLTSHNVYLTMLAEQGLIGLSLYLLPFILLFWRSRNAVSRMPKLGFLNQNMLLSMWLVILAFFVVQNLAPMVVVFGLGLNWITLGLISNFVYLYNS